MAEAVRYVCGECGHAIEAWDEGNPYYVDLDGNKQYAYHPNHDMLALCTGNDSPYLCMSCGHKFKVDSQAPVTSCPK